MPAAINPLVKTIPLNTTELPVQEKITAPGPRLSQHSLCKSALVQSFSDSKMHECHPAEDTCEQAPLLYVTTDDLSEQKQVHEFSGSGSLTNENADDYNRARMNASILLKKPLSWQGIESSAAGPLVSLVAAQMSFYPQAAAQGMESLAGVLTRKGVANAELDGASESLAEGVIKVINSLDKNQNIVVVADRWASEQLKGELPHHVALIASGTNSSQDMKKLVNNPYFKKAATVVAAGGCGALDVTKASSIGKNLVVMPTLLSSNCICCNRAVINNSFSLASTKPQRVIYVQQLLTKGVAASWVNSGLGDYFGVLSAYIDNKNNVGMYTKAAAQGGKGGQIQDMAKPYKEATDLLEHLTDWLDHDANHDNNQGFWLDASHGHDRYNKVIEVLHGTGAEDIRLGTNRYRIGGEHDFYRVLIDDFAPLRTKGPTHGEIVAVGTLLSLHSAKEMKLYEQARAVFQKLGLPIDYSALEQKGMTKAQMLHALQRVAQPEKIGTSILAGHPVDQLEALLDRVLQAAK